MKRKKGRIILGTTAVAAALTLGGCAGGGSDGFYRQIGFKAYSSSGN